MEQIIKTKNILLDLDIDRFLIYFSLTLIQLNGNATLIRKACQVCDLLYEKTKRPLDFNLTESISGLEKLLDKNIYCKSFIKNFIINIQIFKRLKESEILILDDQSTVDINLINFKYQNIEKNKDIINDILENLKNNDIISEDLYRVSLFN